MPVVSALDASQSFNIRTNEFTILFVVCLFKLCFCHIVKTHAGGYGNGFFVVVRMRILNSCFEKYTMKCHQKQKRNRNWKYDGFVCTDGLI